VRGTFGKALLYGAVLIGAYIAVVHYRGVKSDLVAGGQAGSNVAKTLQGR